MNSSKVGIKNKWVDLNEWRIRGYPVKELLPVILVGAAVSHLTGFAWTKSLAVALLTFVAVDITREHDSALIERVFDIDDGWLSKLLMMVAFYVALES